MFGETAMDILYSNVAGMDLHLTTIFVCLRWLDASKRTAVREETRIFGTMTSDILRLRDWLKARHVTHVAMEATGVLWKPIWNLLDGHFTLLLVNPRELKQVPGRKRDISDCQWVAQLLQCGLLRSSFVPPRWQRELRDLTRQRTQLADEHTRTANRIHKVLEDANIKLGAVASDLLGKSGRTMLRALVSGQRDPAKLADLAEGVLRKKMLQLRLALEGHFTEHHQFLITQLMNHLEYLERQIELFSVRIAERLRPHLPDETLDRLDQVGGVNRRTIENVIAETGVDMAPFPNADHLSSWGGMCPRNEESAGKRKRSRCTQGNRWLKRALTEAAWAASHSKHSYLASQYRRLAARRGKKRGLIAVGHSILVILYHMLKEPVEYQDLGKDYLDRLHPERLKRYLVKRLEAMGYQVTLSEPQVA
jgi:transposase